MKYEVIVEGETFLIDIHDEGEVSVNGQVHAVDIQSIDDLSLYSLLVDNNSYEAFIEEGGGQFQVFLHTGEMYSAQVKGGRPRPTMAKSPQVPIGEATIKAPMPGLVVDVPVDEGQPIMAGEVLVILESMKMENELRAEWDGTVRSVHVHPGDVASQDQALVTMRWEEVGNRPSSPKLR